jgi:hypothetical protein
VGALEELIALHALNASVRVAWNTAADLQALLDALPHKLSHEAERGLLLLVRAMTAARGERTEGGG